MITAPFRSIYNIWIKVWEQIPLIVKIWNFPLFNGVLDAFEKTAIWQWITSYIKLENITIPYDITLGDLVFVVGLNGLLAMLCIVALLKFLDLLFFFS